MEKEAAAGRGLGHNGLDATALSHIPQWWSSGNSGHLRTSRRRLRIDRRKATRSHLRYESAYEKPSQIATTDVGACWRSRAIVARRRTRSTKSFGRSRADATLRRTVRSVHPQSFAAPDTPPEMRPKAVRTSRPSIADASSRTTARKAPYAGFRNRGSGCGELPPWRGLSVRLPLFSLSVVVLRSRRVSAT